jgi:hypothetical protein
MIIDSSLTLKYENNEKYVITNIINLESGKSIISFFEEESDDFLNQGGNDKISNISIPIAAATTAYARSYMSIIKNKYQDNLYYSDTDSLYLDVELDPQYISNKELGKFKLERIFDKAIFLTAKMYGGIYFNKNKNRFENYVKIKGLTKSIPFSSLLRLLFKNNHLSIIHEK